MRLFIQLYLYRQYFELAIKNLILQGRQLLDIEAPFPASHNIYKLWQICIALLSELAPGDSEAELKQTERLLQELYKADPTATAFRYPDDKNGKPSLPDLRTINLQNIKEVIAKISVILDGADIMLAQCRREFSEDIYSSIV